MCIVTFVICTGMFEGQTKQLSEVDKWMRDCTSWVTHKPLKSFQVRDEARSLSETSLPDPMRA